MVNSLFTFRVKTQKTREKTKEKEKMIKRKKEWIEFRKFLKLEQKKEKQERRYINNDFLEMVKK